MATFTCTEADVLALEAAAPADGYEVGTIRVRELSRMDVFFVTPTTDDYEHEDVHEEEERIDARCEDGSLDADVN